MAFEHRHVGLKVLEFAGVPNGAAVQFGFSGLYLRGVVGDDVIEALLPPKGVVEPDLCLLGLFSKGAQGRVVAEQGRDLGEPRAALAEFYVDGLQFQEFTSRRHG